MLGSNQGKKRGRGAKKVVAQKSGTKSRKTAETEKTANNAVNRNGTNVMTTILGEYRLEETILQHIFSFLTPQDLMNADLVSTLWRKVSTQKGTWWNLINQHFPFLKEQAAQQYQENPKALFIIHYKKIFQALNAQVQDESTQFLLASLRGDVEKLEHFKLFEPSRKMLYTLCAGNGHLDVLVKISPDKTVMSQLIGASFIGNLPFVKTILTNHGQEITADLKGQTLLVSASSGQLNVVEEILTQCDAQISAVYKGMALCESARRGHPNVVQAILAKCGGQISAENKGEALRNAALNGQTEVVNQLLNQCGAQISAQDKGSALRLAASVGHFNVVQAILTQCGQEISAEDKGEAMRCAALHGHVEVVTELLIRVGDEISVGKKDMALLHSADFGRFNVLQALLSQCGQELSPNFVKLAFNAARVGNRLSIMDALRDHQSKYAQQAPLVPAYSNRKRPWRPIPAKEVEEVKKKAEEFFKTFNKNRKK